MSLPTIDLNAIFWGAVANCIIDTLIFATLKIRSFTVILKLIITFVIPTFSVIFFVNSHSDFNQTIPVFSNYIVAYMYNFVAWLLSCLFGFIISSIIYMASGGHTERPEL